jgi:Ca-activated chloride channel family protein
MHNVSLPTVLAIVLTVVAVRPVPQATFRAASDVVAVYATVRDRNGGLVRGLTRDDFEVRENGKATEIAAFSGDLQPITLAMVLDRSGSLATRIGDVSAAAHGFFEALRAGDRVSLSSLSWDCAPLTDDVARLRGLVQVMPPDVGSPIWEAIDRAFFSMVDESGRQAILVFSDGADSGSPISRFPGFYQGPCQAASEATGATFREVAARAARNGVLVYAVGVEGPSGRRTDSELRTLARDTGGELFRMRHDESLTPVFERIADELHHQYLLGFVPARRDGQVASIDVRVKRPGLQVRARRRYSVAPTPTSASDLVPVAPLSDAEVEAAITTSASTRPFSAGCLTSVSTAGNYFEVTLEGPVGRIMWAARDARQQGTPFGPSDVTSAMRAPTVRVIASARSSPVAEPPDATPLEQRATSPRPPMTPAAFAIGLRLRSPEAARPVVLEPTVASVNRLSPSSTFESVFDLGGVRALGEPIEVVVLGPANGGARCRVSERSLRNLK